MGRSRTRFPLSPSEARDRERGCRACPLPPRRFAARHPLPVGERGKIPATPRPLVCPRARIACVWGKPTDCKAQGFPPMKICIYGAGAIGGYLGVLLKLAGADVSLIARGAHLKAIKDNGLKLRIGGEERSRNSPRPTTRRSSGRRTTSSSRSRRIRRGKRPIR